MDGQDSNQIIIVGAGRQGRNVAEILAETHGTGRIAGYLDDTKQRGDLILGYPVLDGFAAIHDPAFVGRYRWIVAVGDNIDRLELCRSLADAGATFASAIDPTAKVSPSARLKRGLFVGPFVRVASGALISDWSAIEAHANLGVDTSVGIAAFVGPGAQLLGSASLGDRSFLGAAAIITNKVAVGGDCTIGAHSLVLQPLPDGTTAHGTPARPAPLRQRPLAVRVEK